MKKYLLPILSASVLALAACSGPEVTEHDAEAPTRMAVADEDEPVEMTPTEDVVEEPVEEESANVAEDAAEEDAEATPEPAEPELSRTEERFMEAIAEATTPREVRMIYNRIPGEGSGQRMRAAASDKLDTLILEALDSVTTHEEARELQELALRGSDAYTFAQIAMDTYPPAEEASEETSADEESIE